MEKHSLMMKVARPQIHCEVILLIGQDAVINTSGSLRDVKS
jgi:hypothetical protein